MSTKTKTKKQASSSKKIILTSSKTMTKNIPTTKKVTKIILASSIPEKKAISTTNIKLSYSVPTIKDTLDKLDNSKILDNEFYNESEFKKDNNDIMTIDSKIDILFEKKRQILAMIEALNYTKREMQKGQLKPSAL